MRIPHWTAASAFLLALASVSLAAEPQTLDVWPAQRRGPRGVQEKWDKKKVTDVTHPTLEVFRPEKDKDTGVAVIVCPGGGYRALMMDYEGEDVARWLNTIGITGIVLKYRVPAPEGTPRWGPALQDAQWSLSLVRANAKAWNVDPHRIGILGFSAGGHLSAAAATNFDRRSYERIDSVDDVSDRPDFAVAIYPGGVIRRRDRCALARDSRHRPDAADVHRSGQRRSGEFREQRDPLPGTEARRRSRRAARLCQGRPRLWTAKKPNPCSTWPQRCAEWMRHQGILKPAGGNKQTPGETR